MVVGGGDKIVDGILWSAGEKLRRASTTAGIETRRWHWNSEENKEQERKKELKGYVFGETHETHYRERMWVGSFMGLNWFWWI